jgi:chitin disaccharide deacetylase
MKLIVNADDFGLSRGINRGIIQSHEYGIVTSASLFANGPAFDDALEKITTCPKLGVGVHLNVLRGAPVAESNHLSHITRKGFFLSHCLFYRLS